MHVTLSTITAFLESTSNWLPVRKSELGITPKNRSLCLISLQVHVLKTNLICAILDNKTTNSSNHHICLQDYTTLQQHPLHLGNKETHLRMHSRLHRCK